ncbi:hypothetical protein [Bradyrhizobium sp. I1.7.5]|uniref:hypothetical protein n=1 Tax=Bradyrhizobium sp. I1.7.5 TaxID=3156363 RepID=UPI003392D1C9
MIRLLFAALIVSVMTAPASAAETYVCVGEQSTGFKLTGSTWERAGFLANEKFVISQGETQNDYIVKQTGSEKLFITVNARHWPFREEHWLTRK